MTSSFHLLHGTGKLKEIFQKYWKMFKLDYEEILIESRKVAVDIKFFNEFITRTKTANHNYVIKINDSHNFIRNLPEEFGYYPHNFEDEDTVFIVLSTHKIIVKLISEQDIDNIAEFSKFTECHLGFDLLNNATQFIGSGYISEILHKKIKRWLNERNNSGNTQKNT